MKNYVISYDHAGISCINLIRAENAETARAYFESKHPATVIYGVNEDTVGYDRRGCRVQEIPEGWTVPDPVKEAEEVEALFADAEEKVLGGMVAEYKDLQAQIEALQAEAEAIKDKLKGYMVEQGKEVLTGNGWKASWKNVVSARFDSKTFKAENPDLYGSYCKPTTTCRFVLA